MAEKKSTKRGRRKAKRSVNKVSAEIISDRIEEERRRLNKASAVLIGAELTAEYCPERGLVTDAISVASDLITQAVEALDAVALRRVRGAA
jgi:hypothetical protein